MSSSITLSAATRQNLLSLQGTADLLATTQNRLATNKKVNSALDNPTNFFTADALSSRSKSLSSLLDSISNGIQTIQAANTGLTKLQGLTDQLKSISQQAIASANAFTSKANSVSTALTGATASNLLSTGPTQAVSDTALGSNSAAVASTSTAGTAYANGVATIVGSAAYVTLTGNATVTVAGTAVSLVTGDTITDAIRKINAVSSTTGVTASDDGTGKLSLTTGTSGTNFDVVATGTETKLQTSSAPTTTGAGASSTTVNVNGTDIAIATGSTQAQAMAAINAFTSTTGVTASNSSGSILLTGPADGASFTVKAGTGNKTGFATTLATSTGGTFHPAATTLAISLGFKAGDSFTVNGQAVNVAAGDTINSLTQKVTTATNGTVSATFDATNRKFNFTAADANTGVTLANGSSATALVSNLGYSTGRTTFAAGLGASGSTSPISGTSLTVQVGTGIGTTVTFGTSPGQISSLTQLNAALAPANAQASIDSVSGKITITTTNDFGADNLTVSGAAAFASGTTTAIIGGDGAAARRNAVVSYNNLLNQINQLASDAGFNGMNLLAGDNLKVVFNEKGSSLLSVQGSTVNTSNLGLGPIDPDGFQENGSINKVILAINSASSQLKSQASSLGSNLAVVQNRQDFTKQIINVLDTGAGNLVNADLNEEAANSQALSTRNSLGISALSLANQAQQGVLQLLR